MKVNKTLFAVAFASLFGSSSAMASGTLSSSEAKTLTFMAEEEKLARDVYRSLHEKWGIQTFSNISGSEQRHMSRMLNSLSQYGLSNPVTNDSTGVFADKKLASLYSDLVAKGGSSELAALKVGGFIEELDIKDLQDAIRETNQPDLKRTYENLLRGSRNHLRAFVRQINQQERYVAQVLPQSEVDAIVNSPSERGGNGSKGKGKGHGKGMGQGKGMGNGNRRLSN